MDICKCCFRDDLIYALLHVLYLYVFVYVLRYLRMCGVMYLLCNA